MQKKDELDGLIVKVKSLPEPWCNFSLDKECRYDIRGENDYNAHGAVRELIYYKYKEETSISMGRLPPIISPMFWETYSGLPIEKIKSLKNPGKCIKKESYEKNKRMARYWKEIRKVYPINLEAYLGSLNESYIKHDLQSKERLRDVNRRINGLKTFKKSLERNEWPRLLVIVPNDPEIEPLDRSFTITPHMEVELIRGEGSTDHQGWLYYSPKKTDYLMTAWNKKWNIALKYTRSRDDWPNDFISIDSLDQFKKQCQKFNIKSTDRLIDVLDKYKSDISDKKVVDANNKSKVFLCHSSNDKGAIVRRFDELCRAKGIDTWYDENEINWGDRILEKISNGLADSKYIIVFIAKDTLSKKWVLEELTTALTSAVDNNKTVLPILLGYSIEELKKKQPILGSRRCLTITVYNPSIKVDSKDLEYCADELEKLLKKGMQI